MSQFSEQLHYYIKENGSSIFQLAKKSGVERTTIQRSITGERVPSAEFVEKLCNYLQISPIEKKDLLKLHQISQIGEDVYQRRQYVKELIEQLSVVDISTHPDQHYQKSVRLNEEISSAIKVYSGKQMVNNMLHDILEDEIFNQTVPQINLNVPFGYTYLFDTLRQLYLVKKGKASISHLLSLVKKPANKKHANTNLEIFAYAVPFAFYLGDGYKPYYHYTNEELGDKVATFMPYYLYTSTRLITISTDFETAILYNDLELKKLYHQHFQEFKSVSRPFLEHTNSINDIISSYKNAHSISESSIHAIEPQPCLAKYYTTQLIEKHLTKDVPQREFFKQSLTEFYREFYSPKLCLSTFFSVEGLDFLTNHGRVTDLPSSLVIPFSPAELNYLLTSLKNDIQLDKVVSRVIISDQMVIPPCITVQMSGENNLIIVITSEAGITFSYLNEVSICSAFHDFFTSLVESDLVYSKNETIAILDKALMTLQKNS